MKKFITVVLMVLVCSSVAYAEATFDQIQGLIKSGEYAAAVQGLNVIIQNHPRSAKAYYAMSQAQAGIGNQAKAKEALDMARGLDPSLKFAPSSNVEKLKEAIQPQTQKIVAIESHTGRNILIALVLLGGGIAGFLYYRRKKNEKESIPAGSKAYKDGSYDPPTPKVETPIAKATERTYSAPTYTRESYRPSFQPSYRQEAAPTLVAPAAPTQHTTVVNNGNDGLVTGMVLGSLMGGGHHHHDPAPAAVEREVVREPSYVSSPKVEREESSSSSWDSGSSSSSWDDDESKKSSSSSWDSGSSSSSSSWDSGSSSSSSWDSGSSSSSSSSWD